MTKMVKVPFEDGTTRLIPENAIVVVQNCEYYARDGGVVPYVNYGDDVIRPWGSPSYPFAQRAYAPYEGEQVLMAPEDWTLGLVEDNTDCSEFMAWVRAADAASKEDGVLFTYRRHENSPVFLSYGTYELKSLYNYTLEDN